MIVAFGFRNVDFERLNRVKVFACPEINPKSATKQTREKTLTDFIVKLSRPTAKTIVIFMNSKITNYIAMTAKKKFQLYILIGIKSALELPAISCSIFRLVLLNGLS